MKVHRSFITKLFTCGFGKTGWQGWQYETFCCMRWGWGRDRGVGVELTFAIYNMEISVETNAFLLIRLSHQLPRVLGIRHEVLVDIVGTVFGRYGGLCRGLSSKTYVDVLFGSGICYWRPFVFELNIISTLPTICFFHWTLRGSGTVLFPQLLFFLEFK